MNSEGPLPRRRKSDASLAHRLFELIYTNGKYSMFIVVIAIAVSFEIASTFKESVLIQEVTVWPNSTQPELQPEWLQRELVVRLDKAFSDSAATVPATKVFRTDPIMSKVSFGVNHSGLALSDMVTFIKSHLPSTTVVSCHFLSNGSDFSAYITVNGRSLPIERSFKSESEAIDFAKNAILASVSPIGFANFIVERKADADEALNLLDATARPEGAPEINGRQTALAKSILFHAKGALVDAIREAKKALGSTQDPELALTLAHWAYLSGDWQSALQYSLTAQANWTKDYVTDLSENNFQAELIWAHQMISRAKADYIAAHIYGLEYSQHQKIDYERLDDEWDSALDLIRGGDLLGAIKFAETLDYSAGANGPVRSVEGPAEVNMQIALTIRDAEEFRRFTYDVDHIHRCEEPEKEQQRIVMHQGWMALGEALNHNFDAANRLIFDTPSRCFWCRIAHANIASLEGNSAQAMREFDAIAGEFPDLPQAFLERGKYLATLYNTTHAIDDFNRAVGDLREAIRKSEDKWFLPYFYLWRLYQVFGDQSKSDDSYGRARKINPQFSDWVRLSSSQTRISDWPPYFRYVLGEKRGGFQTICTQKASD